MAQVEQSLKKKKENERNRFLKVLYNIYQHSCQSWSNGCTFFGNQYLSTITSFSVIRRAFPGTTGYRLLYHHIQESQRLCNITYRTRQRLVTVWLSLQEEISFNIQKTNKNVLKFNNEFKSKIILVCIVIDIKIRSNSSNRKNVIKCHKQRQVLKNKCSL